MDDYCVHPMAVVRNNGSQKEVLPGFEPGSPDSESEVLTSYTIRPYGGRNTPGGTRTHNLTLRRGTRYPLRYGGQ